MLYNPPAGVILTDRRKNTMHVPRSDRSLDFIARGCSPGMVLMYIPVVLLTALLGLSIACPYVAGSVALWVLYLAARLGFSPDTLLLLTAVVPLLHALLQHSNRRHGIGGGRCLLYMGVYLSPIAFACLYYAGLQLVSAAPSAGGATFPCSPVTLSPAEDITDITQP